MAPYARRATSTIVVGVSRRLAFLALVFAVFVVSACGTSTRIATGPTDTQGPITPPHGVLYAVASNQVGSGPPTSDVYALKLSDGKQVWRRHVTGTVYTPVLGG